MRKTRAKSWIFGFVCLRFAGCLLALEEELDIETKSYLSEPAISLNLSEVTEVGADQVLTFKALISSRASIIFSEFEQYTPQAQAGAASAVLARNLVDASMEFWLQASNLEHEDLNPQMVLEHFAYLEQGLSPQSKFQALLVPVLGERIYDRYFRQKPFELAYSFTELDENGETSETVVHENWMARDGFFLAVRLICQKKNYPGLLKEARKKWKDAYLSVE